MIWQLSGTASAGGGACFYIRNMNACTFLFSHHLFGLYKCRL